jgi:hypothetical protein
MFVVSCCSWVAAAILSKNLAFAGGVLSIMRLPVKQSNDARGAIQSQASLNSTHPT